MANTKPGNTIAVYTIILFVIGTVTFGTLYVMKNNEFKKGTEDREAAAKAKTVAETKAATLEGLNEYILSMIPADKRSLDRAKDQIIADYDADVKKLLSTDGATFQAAVTLLRSKITDSETQIKGLQAQIADRQKKLDDMKAQYEGLEAKRDADKKALEEKIAAVETEHKAFQEMVKKQHEEAQKLLEQIQAASTAKLAEKDKTVSDREKEINLLNARIRELVNKFGQDVPTAPDLKLQPDARVISVASDTNLVYIPLGRNDHLVRGMTFEVFDPNVGIEVKKENNGERYTRGKATIEVVTIGENSSACRIVRQSLLQSVLVGDLVANLIYDKNRVFKFFVVGDFDLDYDGRPDNQDYDQIVKMVQNWGGKVVTSEERAKTLARLPKADMESSLTLPLDTDFLVMGQEPPVPEPIKNDDDAETIKRKRDAVAKYSYFQKLAKEAETLKVSRLNQSQFLVLIGYSFK